MTENIKTKEYYKTADLNPACILDLNGFSIDALEKDKTNYKVSFYFRRVEGIDSIIEKYFSKKLLVEPTEYSNAIKMLKTRIYNQG